MIAIINYGLGNLRSVAGAVEKVGFKPVITNKPSEIENAEKIILPGVGAFGDGMKNLREFELIDCLERTVLGEKKPVLGICLGFQLMCRSSCEFGTHSGLGWIDADVEKLDTKDGQFRLPHVGWNDLYKTKDIFLFKNIPEEALFYYVHSYHVCCNDHEIVVGECEYSDRFVAAVGNQNIWGTQFHPEKSQKWGLQLLQNFLESA
jgi:glutamine amidotransferase